MIKLSVVIITFNEEQNIEKCLVSVKDIADEIIVLDSFSTDKTEEICKSHNVKFFKHKFDGHIQQKNRVITFAKNDFVLSLDADEVISDELKKSILKIKQGSEYDAYYFNRLNIYCGKKIKSTSWYPDKKIRLWNKHKAKWGGENPHDTVILNKDATKKYIKGDLLHFSFNSIEEHIQQTNKFTTISADFLNKSNKKSSVFKIIYKTFFAFIKEFIFKYAPFSGFYGFVIGGINVFSVFLKYSKLLKLNREDK